jgi:peptide methionine sulfoxide reductase msrA/msrB
MSDQKTIQYRKPSQEDLKQRLSGEQFHCSQEAGTEPPFQNKYYNHKEDGIYVDIVSGQPLFSSLDKYDSGSGWPSYTKPLSFSNLTLKEDGKFGMNRTEVRSRLADSHLGHVFDDGPTNLGGKRYCINSASLNFIPLTELKAHGLGRHLFDFAARKGWETITLAGGCFWGVEEIFRKQKGVIETKVGFTGGLTQAPSYTSVKEGDSGHAEAVQLLFDPGHIQLDEILRLFFRLHDPTVPNRQGNDIGTQYRSAIFYHSEIQKKCVEAIVNEVAKSGAWIRPLTTESSPFTTFWDAEEYHQKYLEKNPGGYTCHFVRDIKF